MQTKKKETIKKNPEQSTNSQKSCGEIQLEKSNKTKTNPIIQKLTAKQKNARVKALHNLRTNNQLTVLKSVKQLPVLLLFIQANY